MRRRTVVYIVAGVAALIAFGVVGAIASDDRDDRRRAHAEATAIAAATTNPVESVADCPWGDASCVLALGIERALQSGNVDAVVSFTAPRLFICPGAKPDGAGGPFPLCEGAEKDDGRTGLPIGRRYSEGGVINVQGVHDMLQSFIDSINASARDAVGDGKLRLYAFTCSTPAIRFQNVSCAREGIVLSAIVGKDSSQHRELLIFWAVAGLQGKTLPVAEIWDGLILPDEVSVLFKDGGHLSDLGEVYAIDQSLRKPQ
jgi:hypothetical protein